MKHLLVICAYIQIWECKDHAKLLSLSAQKQKHTTKANISMREIARCKG